jgi:zinc transporter
MRSHLALADELFKALEQDSRSTRIEDAQDNLVAVVNDVAYDLAFDPSEIATLWMCVGRGIAVSARAHPLRSIDQLRESVRQGARFGSSVDLLSCRCMHRLRTPCRAAGADRARRNLARGYGAAVAER